MPDSTYPSPIQTGTLYIEMEYPNYSKAEFVKRILVPAITNLFVERRRRGVEPTTNYRFKRYYSIVNMREQICIYQGYKVKQ